MWKCRSGLHRRHSLSSVLVSVVISGRGEPMGHEEKVGVERGTFAPCCVADCVGLVRHCMSSEGCHGIVCIYTYIRIGIPVS